MNQVKISSDGTCVYLQVKAVAATELKWLTRILLVSFMAGLLTFIFVPGSAGKYIGLLLTGGAALIFVPLAKTILWNLFGQEFYSISSKSLKYQHDFGFFITPEITVPFQKSFSFNFEIMRETNNKEIGQIYFYTHDEQNQPKEILHTNAHASHDDFRALSREIEKIFAAETQHSFSLN